MFGAYRRMGTELDNESLMIPDVFSDFYDDWLDQIVHPVCRKYNVPVFSAQQQYDFRKCGIVERRDDTHYTRII